MFLVIDSRDREAPGRTTPNDYVVRLPEVLRRVRRVQLVSVELAVAMYCFSRAAGTAEMRVTVDGETRAATVPDGNYSATAMAGALRAGLAAAWPERTWVVSMNRTTGKASVGTAAPSAQVTVEDGGLANALGFVNTPAPAPWLRLDAAGLPAGALAAWDILAGGATAVDGAVRFDGATCMASARGFVIGDDFTVVARVRATGAGDVLRLLAPQGALGLAAAQDGTLRITRGAFRLATPPAALRPGEWTVVAARVAAAGSGIFVNGAPVPATADPGFDAAPPPGTVTYAEVRVGEFAGDVSALLAFDGALTDAALAATCAKLASGLPLDYAVAEGVFTLNPLLRVCMDLRDVGKTVEADGTGGYASRHVLAAVPLTVDAGQYAFFDREPSAPGASRVKVLSLDRLAVSFRARFAPVDFQMVEHSLTLEVLFD